MRRPSWGIVSELLGADTDVLDRYAQSLSTGQLSLFVVKRCVVCRQKMWRKMCVLGAAAPEGCIGVA